MRKSDPSPPATVRDEFHYVPTTPQDCLWGLSVTAAGRQTHKGNAQRGHSTFWPGQFTMQFTHQMKKQNVPFFQSHAGQMRRTLDRSPPSQVTYLLV
jgi:hypothetical protein